MATGSFADIENHNWQPGTSYQSVQTQIQQEVNQGLWQNQAHPDTWCCIQTSAPHGTGNSWVTHTYQHSSNPTLKGSVVWPAGWPPPAENINSVLPSHFFGSSTGGGGTAPGALSLPVSQTTSAPTSQPGYKPAGLCM